MIPAPHRAAPVQAITFALQGRLCIVVVVIVVVVVVVDVVHVVHFAIAAAFMFVAAVLCTGAVAHVSASFRCKIHVSLLLGVS